METVITASGAQAAGTTYTVRVPGEPLSPVTFRQLNLRAAAKLLELLGYGEPHRLLRMARESYSECGANSNVYVGA